MATPYLIYTFVQFASALGVCPLTLRNRVENYSEGRVAGFNGFIPHKINKQWYFSSAATPVAIATEQQVLALNKSFGSPSKRPYGAKSKAPFVLEEEIAAVFKPLK